MTIDEQRLRELESASRTLHPSAEQRGDLLASVNERAEAFLERLDTMPAYTPPDPADLGVLDEPFGDEPAPIDRVLAAYARGVERPGVNETVGRFFGFIPGSGLYAAALGDYLAAVTNPYAGVTYASPGAVRLERRLLRWVADFIGYPESAAGDLTSGGSIAILSAIVTAREACGVRARDVERTVVYLTAQTHHCVDKALAIAGVGECVQRRIPLDARYRMDVAALEAQIAQDHADGLRPWLVVASAGTTDTGAVDPLPAIADVAEREGLWLHVDGAYGAAFALTADGKARLAGMERADSLVLDPHKGLFLPFGTGLVLVRDGRKLRDAYTFTASYMQDTGGFGEAMELSPAAASPELSRHFRALRLWLPLKLAGVDAFRAALEEKLLLARYFHARMTELPGFEVGPEPDLSIVVFRYVPEEGDADAFNRRLAERIQADGRIYLSTTRLGGHNVLRLAILNVRSHRREVDLAVKVIRETAAALDGRADPHRRD
ncbi:pyridoxal phosphate-dependent decarboxylase family protein [Lentisalinibacter orientalis]|uniref:pyridoxal phosphate-dependent decarboxylase family protein n=1 Tax=Lentisalinibacter orientalis TaxID=2992241 RepID=UPI003865BCB0